MTLDSIFMPRPAGVEGQRVEPLGPWPALPPEMAKQIRARERWRRYAEAHKAKRVQAMRDYRARKAGR